MSKNRWISHFVVHKKVNKLNNHSFSFTVMNTVLSLKDVNLLAEK